MKKEGTPIVLKLGMAWIGQWPKGKGLRLPLSPNRKVHWGERIRWNKAWRFAVEAASLDAYGMLFSYPPAKALVEIELRMTKMRDDDNADGSCKPILDALKGTFIVDDDPKHCKFKRISKKVGHKDEEGVVIRIWPR